MNWYDCVHKWLYADVKKKKMFSNCFKFVFRRWNGWFVFVFLSSREFLFFFVSAKFTWNRIHVLTVVNQLWSNNDLWRKFSFAYLVHRLSWTGFWIVSFSFEMLLVHDKLAFWFLFFLKFVFQCGQCSTSHSRSDSLTLMRSSHLFGWMNLSFKSMNLPWRTDMK